MEQRQSLVNWQHTDICLLKWIQVWSHVSTYGIYCNYPASFGLLNRMVSFCVLLNSLSIEISLGDQKDWIFCS